MAIYQHPNKICNKCGLIISKRHDTRCKKIYIKKEQIKDNKKSFKQSIKELTNKKIHK